MSKRLCLKCGFLILFLGGYALIAHFLMEFEQLSKKSFNMLPYYPARVGAIFILSILLGFFLYLPVTGKWKFDVLIPVLVIGVLTVYQVFCFVFARNLLLFEFTHYLFDLWLPIVLVCAGTALGGKLVGRRR